MGKLIVLEGLDGSGKATQSRLLTAALEREGRRVRRISFPDYESNASWPVRMYLGGEFGPKPEDVNAYAASVLYAVDRFASYRKDWGEFYRDGGILIADRYTTSNAVHQCSKLPREEWDGYLDWLFDLEYRKIGIPAPDAVFYLEVDPAVSQRLLSGRYQGDEGKKDIHERDARISRPQPRRGGLLRRAAGLAQDPLLRSGRNAAAGGDRVPAVRAGQRAAVTGNGPLALDG